MNKICQTCKTNFVIEPQDLKFYERVSSPLPEYCPDCRMQRRLVWRNERTLYKGKCDLCKKETISIYPSGTAWPVYCSKCWYSDGWDPKAYGAAYDPAKPFFEQYRELQNNVPRVALISATSVNSEYCNNAVDNKNCYLIFAAEQNEDSLYGRLVQRCKEVVDTTFIYDSEFCYEGIDLRRCSNVLFSERCQQSLDLLFCFNARDSQSCIFSWNLRHQSYMIENKKVTKEEFERKKREILSSRKSIEAAKKHFEELKSKVLVKYAFQTKCVGASGDYLFNCHNSKFVYDAENLKDCGHLADIAGAVDCHDGNNMYYTPELCYDLMGVIKCYQSKHSIYVFYSTGLEYCNSCENSEYLFGCIALRKQKYCILNKQYSKEEYAQIKENIVEQMKKERMYGQFFPPSLSPFGYNETLAKDYFPLSKEEALGKNFRWQDNTTGTFGKETIKKGEIPNTIEEVNDSILQDVLVCEECGKNFRIIKPELDFYRKMHLPLPRKDFECRHQERMAKRTPRKLWHRACACNQRLTTSDKRHYENTAAHFHGDKPCPNEFETSYAPASALLLQGKPERKEIVYCEACYLQEVA